MADRDRRLDCLDLDLALQPQFWRKVPTSHWTGPYARSEYRGGDRRGGHDSRTRRKRYRNPQKRASSLF